MTPPPFTQRAIQNRDPATGALWWKKKLAKEEASLELPLELPL